MFTMKDEKTFTLGEGERLERINRDLRLIQNLDGLVYGTDAYMLAAFIKPQKNGAACELGAGTGVISILCADADKFASIEAVEIQPYYAELTERNVSLNGLDGKINVRCADVRDLGGVMCGSFDAVFANPPYMKTGNGKANANEKKYIARHEVKGGICDFVKAASRLLKFGGRFYCVMRPDRLCDLMCYMRECKIEPKRIRTRRGTLTSWTAIFWSTPTRPAAFATGLSALWVSTSGSFWIPIAVSLRWRATLTRKRAHLSRAQSNLVTLRLATF